MKYLCAPAAAPLNCNQLQSGRFVFSVPFVISYYLLHIYTYSLSRKKYLNVNINMYLMGEATNESELNSTRARIVVCCKKKKKNGKSAEKGGERWCIWSSSFRIAHLRFTSISFHLVVVVVVVLCIYSKFVCCFVFDYLSTLFCRVLLVSTYFFFFFVIP